MCAWFGGPGAGGWFGGGIFMMLPMLIFWGLILWGGFILGRKLILVSQENRPAGESRTALEILKERYAKGEISREEFEKMKQDLL
ncbi:hypothetical protein P22_1422 [Propionispora sp. 2/2-37]|uniref:SHOCT domain-containing protein n=1 Tax=Propionispora sp. 2/2-37 TaxID=1677858 RepID=UPI0006BB6EF1|nr:SHOCT domain-containing protein [Propionispora sp. 2/2-37]CUH95352.1 hypothetical protein P22_1422 [Propionispora sp. 2/2-37]